MTNEQEQEMCERNYCDEVAVNTCPNGFLVCQAHAEEAWEKDGIHS
jgi:hypothetical protein